MDQEFLRAPERGADAPPAPHSAPPVLAVVGPPTATATACKTLSRMQLDELRGVDVVARETSSSGNPLTEDREVAALLVVQPGDGADLPGLVARIQRELADPLTPVLVRCTEPPNADTANALWNLGVADLQFEQALDDPALAGATAVALRDAARRRALARICSSSARLAIAPTLGEQAALALRLLAEHGFGRGGALFCFQRSSGERRLLAITGSGKFADVDCTPVDHLNDTRLRALIEAALSCGETRFADDLAALHIGSANESYRALIAIALDAPLLPWQRGLLVAFADAVAPAIADRQRSHQLARTQHAMISTLARLAEYKDADTGEHVARVARMTAEIAGHLARSGTCPEAEELVDHIGHASILHDVGKVAIAESVLLKPGALDAEERRAINAHVTIGHEILREAAALAAHGEARLFHLASEIARGHHEKWDGSGYPDGLRGDHIPLSARIVAVVDVYDALVSHRPYKEAWTEERALALIRAESGRHFDPDVVDAFFAVKDRKAGARFIEWTAAMSVGHPDLDRDHQRLIRILNNLGINMELGNRNVVEFILDDLADYAQVHFRREESHLERIGFPDLARHRAIHDAISRRIDDAKWKYFQGFAATLEGELLVFLTTWLNNHILVEDMKYNPDACVPAT